MLRDKHAEKGAGGRGEVTVRRPERYGTVVSAASTQIAHGSGIIREHTNTARGSGE